MSIISSLKLAIASIIFTLSASLPAFAVDDNFSVEVNKAVIHQLEKPMSDIIIGDSSLISISIIDKKNIVLNGIRPGETNLIILDEERKPQLNVQVVVSVEQRDSNQVTMYRHNQGVMSVQSLICENQQCAPSISPDRKSVV